MYKYKIGFNSYEESSYVELEHEKKFTHQELLDLIAEATVETIKQLKKLNNSNIHSFKDVFYGNFDKITITNYLINNKGFKSIEYTETISIFGWPSIFTKNDWESDRDNDLNYITNKVIQAGFTIKDDDLLKDQIRENKNENS